MIIGSQQAFTHPHAWITTKADLLFDRHNSLAAIGHQWDFDEALFFVNVEFATECPVTLDGQEEFMSGCNAQLARPKLLDAK